MKYWKELPTCGCFPAKTANKYFPEKIKKQKTLKITLDFCQTLKGNTFRFLKKKREDLAPFTKEFCIHVWREKMKIHIRHG